MPFYRAIIINNQTPLLLLIKYYNKPINSQHCLSLISIPYISVQHAKKARHNFLSAITVTSGLLSGANEGTGIATCLIEPKNRRPVANLSKNGLDHCLHCAHCKIFIYCLFMLYSCKLYEQIH